MRKQGFTLIEAVVTIGVIGIVLPAFFMIVYTIFNQQIRIGVLNEVKNQGDFALTTMKNVVRNSATSTYDSSDPATRVPLCDTVTTAPVPLGYFGDKYSANNWFRFYLDSSDAIASEASTLAAPVKLTNSKVKIINFNLHCEQSSDFSPPLISINFDITYNSEAEGMPQLHYSTKVKLRESP